MPALESDRLILRPPNPRDIEAMAVWLGDYDVAKMTAHVPHPYGERDAAAFVAAAPALRFVIQRKADGVFLGMAGLHPEDGRELGYWLGKPFWGQGYASEAARRLVAHAFAGLGWAEIRAAWFHDNPASGHVLAKLGGRACAVRLRDCRARGHKVLCHEMVLTRADFLRKRAA
jgi:RimJ/RimL family protein N-acetyltransferase